MNKKKKAKILLIVCFLVALAAVTFLIVDIVTNKYGETDASDETTIEDNINAPIEDHVPTCYSDGVEISVDEYEAIVAEYYPEDRVSSSGEINYSLTEENINKYVTE